MYLLYDYKIAQAVHQLKDLESMIFYADLTKSQYDIYLLKDQVL